MGKGYKHGGANPLNFIVKTYPSETELKADKPKENTIGVITTTTMTSWVFSAKEPTEPEVGMVWILIGTSSNGEFNALKKNTLQVYPLKAKQYASGKWNEIPAMNYHADNWEEWLFYLAYEIDHFTEVRESGTGSIKIEDGTIVATTTGTTSNNQGSVSYFSDKTFDLKEFKTLTFHLNKKGYGYCFIGFSDVNNKYNPGGTQKIYDANKNSIDEDVTIDISAVDTNAYFHICITGYYTSGNTATATLTDIVLNR